ncbi:hypothetical protein [Actinomadura chibensis]|uniref:Uncharacterized protein n=1 Tax=Actinomadura chibensis TaxID=392828 RepID=A0A5D0NCB1_9ACTN|nr:hypothetical protein [Actinomadura chibensis]TYB41835.1 hypothetical protein FXF69_33415 [Actinomadura chibensis]
MAAITRAGVAVLAVLVYYLVVVPVGLAVRLVRDPLRRRPDPAADSYWTYPDRAPRRRPPDSEPR